MLTGVCLCHDKDAVLPVRAKHGLYRDDMPVECGRVEAVRICPIGDLASYTAVVHFHLTQVKCLPEHGMGSDSGPDRCEGRCY